MTLELTRQQLPELKTRLEPLGLDAKYMVRGLLTSEMEHPHGYKIFVDKWPNFTLVVFRADYTKAIKFIQTFVVLLYIGDNMEVYKEIVKKSLPWGQPMNIAFSKGTLLDPSEQVSKEFKYRSTNTFHGNAFEATKDSLPDFPLPEGYTATTLTVDDASFVSSIWTPALELMDLKYVDEYIRFSVTHLPSVAIKDSSGNIVAYELLHESGQLGMLHVDEAHRGKGIAKYVVVTLSRKVLDLGMVAYCVIELENEISVNLHKKCGYKEMTEIKNLILHNNESSTKDEKQGCCFLKEGLLE